jgi:hypothetical protein
LIYTNSNLTLFGMSFEVQIKNLELRLTMAIQHVVQAAADLDAIRARAGLPAARPLFHLAPNAETGWSGSNGVAELRARQAAKAPSARAAAAAEPRISPEMWRHLAERGRRERGEPDPAAPIDAEATARAIVRAAAIASGELVELPEVGSIARAILESAAKRRSTDIDGRPL